MKGLRKILLTMAIIISIITFAQVNAENYQSFQSRVNQNTKMLGNKSNNSEIAAERYTEKSLKDLKELNYKGLTSNQQTKIKNFTTNVVFENINYTKSEKIAKIYDFMLKNFYYYKTPDKIFYLNSSTKEYNNPYSLITKEYERNGKIRAKNDGFVATFVSFARIENIPARIVEGYYDESLPQKETPLYLTKSNANHKWVEVYLYGSWISLDPTSDCNNRYSDTTNEYIQVPSSNVYYSPSLNQLSKTHIILNYSKGKLNAEYITNPNETKQIKAFLNKTKNKKTNGKRINKSYNQNNSKTWFSKKTKTTNDGYGNAVNLYWDENKNLTGALNLNNFTELKKVFVPNNKITSLTITNNPKLEGVYVYNNNLAKITVTGSKLKALSARFNPATYIKYNFGPSKSTGILKTTTGGTISVFYKQTSSGYKHTLKAVPKKGYQFVGWYNGSKRITTKKDTYVYKKGSFTYKAKFKKINKTYILVSIPKQKLWYYKNGKLKLSSKVVTGKRYKYDTPRGTFKVIWKSRNIYLIGPDYKSFVNYWMLIDKKRQIGLHDASWRDTFGGSIYKYNGSHGCINLPYQTAKKLYRTVPRGTVVIVK